MKKMRYIIFMFVLFMPFMAFSQHEGSSADNPMIAFRLVAKAGLNIGAATPLSIPVEIREMKGYNPGLNGSIGVDALMDFDSLNTSRWTVGTGLYVERKSMTTKARTKNYSTEIVNNGNVISGVWTGDVETAFSAHALSLPVFLSYRAAPKFSIRAGVYVSFLFSKTFEGSVYDGYLREGNPTGEKIVFENGSSAQYEFSDELKNVHSGLLLGAEYNVSKRFIVSGQLTYGLSDIFKRDFKTVSFAMHPIFFNLSIGYWFL